MSALLQMSDLKVSLQTQTGWLEALGGVSLEVHAGETLGLVGESGCGKSLTALSILRLLPQPYSRIDKGAIFFNGEDVLGFDETRLKNFRGKEVSLVFQDAGSALNPVRSVGAHLTETLLTHFPHMGKEELHQRSCSLLELVGLKDPELRLRSYPHELSGGMRQRVMIALGVACEPKLLIADEPTSALDVSLQAMVLDLIKELQALSHMAVILISHDLDVVSSYVDKVAVMYGGRVAEIGKATEILRRPFHPYTRGLLTAMPHLKSKTKTALPVIPGIVPSLNEMPSGCRFAARCTFAEEKCRRLAPEVKNVEGQNAVACYHHADVRALGEVV